VKVRREVEHNKISAHTQKPALVYSEHDALYLMTVTPGGRHRPAWQMSGLAGLQPVEAIYQQYEDTVWPLRVATILSYLRSTVHKYTF